MNKSTYYLIGIPDNLGVLIAILSIILFIAPYAAGADFGIFKVPVFPDKTKRKLKKIGPLAVLFSLLLFVPFWPNPDDKGEVALKNPFGEYEVLVKSHDLFSSQKEIASLKKPLFGSNKYLLFQNKPDGILRFDELSGAEYAEIFSKQGARFLDGFPILRDAHVFRVYAEPPLKIKTSPKTYAGHKATQEQYIEAWHYYTQSESDPPNLNKLFKEARLHASELTDDEWQDELRAILEMKGLEGAELEKALSEQISRKDVPKELNNILTPEGTIYNELSIVVIDRVNFEKVLIASRGGQLIKATSFNFLIAAGGTLPAFDITSVKHASVSKDSSIWAFYGESIFKNIEVNGSMVKEFRREFYRLYAMNDAYIYQITLSFSPITGQSRKVWDKLLEQLQSIRIVK